MTLRYWTAGESHGKTLVAILDGFPAGVELDTGPIDAELRRRQGGYGRGGRQRIETDAVELLSGIWRNVSLGSPIALQVVNKDYKLERLEDLARPRPGHGDLTGAMKYLGPIRGVLERASARETTVRVAAGAVARQLLSKFGIEVIGYVVELGGIKLDPPEASLDDRLRFRASSEIYSLDPSKDAEVKSLIDECGKEGDTLGGIVEVRVVQGVEHLCPELKFEPLSELERLDKTKVEIPVTGRDEDVATGAVLTWCREAKRLCQINAARQGIDRLE